MLSRQAFLHPPPTAQLDPRALATVSHSGGLSTQTLTVSGLVVGMALIEVVLLAGPAFAVGARRRRRELALVSAVGGERRDLRNIVLAGGVFLGFTAGLLAILGAVGLTAIGIPLLQGHVNRLPGAYDLRAVELSMLILVGLAAAIAAAVVPAHLAARTDVLAALAGRRGATRARARLAGAAGSRSAVIILVGVGLVEFGLIACTPTLLGLAARLSASGPLPTRLAARNAGRNRSAATPAVAAVMASVIGAVALLVALASSDQRDHHNYLPTFPIATSFTVLVTTGPTGPVPSQISSVEHAMQRTLPTSLACLLNIGHQA